VSDAKDSSGGQAESLPAAGETPDAGQAYRVLARKYRPQTFADLIGQNAVVRTLSNAFATGRIAQAYMLTGVRGVGKTTTARLIARALNYETDAGEGGPSLDLSELGRHCQAIMESRHVDVVEMDAASHTGIDDIREIIEAVRYRPASARYKVYIIDEVHMLSKAAFNGLLKTLEEPPPHVKFVFATTEVRKVPVTVLSRCQRFDLRRIEAEQLIFHLSKIAGLENVKAQDEALALIARAAEGSVRDGLSLLDQAIALCGASIATDDVRQMLGLADRARTIDLLDRVLAGDVAAALDELKAQHDAGADPLVVVTDLAALVHWITRLKLVPAAGNDISVPEEERTRGAAMAERLSMRVLTRAWQMLLKGVDEIQGAANPMAAADMVLVRLAYVADLPAPDELVRKLEAEPVVDTGGTQPRDAGAPAQPAPRAADDRPAIAQAQAAQAIEQQAAPVPEQAETEPRAPQPQSFEEVVALAAEKRDIKLKTALERNVRLVSFRPGHLDISLAEGTQTALVGELTRRLSEWTGERWIVSLSQDEGDKTLFEKTKEREDAALADAMRDPVVDAALKLFPGAEILAVRDTFELDPPQSVDDETGEPDY
jgi:DNA polymerase-3 subunit gamma/tau